MPQVRRAPARKEEIYVARAVPSALPEQKSDRLVLHKVLCSDGTCTAWGAHGISRSGRQMDVKTDLHWVMEPVPGGMEIRPVKGWYDLVQTNSAGAGKQLVPAKRPPEAANVEIQKQVCERKEIADRWDKMRKRGKEEEPRAGPSLTRKPKVSTNAVAYPDKQQSDETGIKKQEEKRRKVLRKQEMAHREGAEEEAVPDVASSLHELKRQKGGEAGWDFSDEEQFSDDQEERFDFDDQLEGTAAQTEDQGMPAGEEVAAEDDGENQDVQLSTFGEEVEVLLKGPGGTMAASDAHDSPALAEPEEEDCSSPRAPASPCQAKTATEASQCTSERGAQLQQLAVKCLQEKGGEMTLKELNAILEVQKGQKEYLAPLAQVLFCEKRSGEAGEIVVVKLRGHPA